MQRVRTCFIYSHLTGYGVFLSLRVYTKPMVYIIFRHYKSFIPGPVNNIFADSAHVNLPNLTISSSTNGRTQTRGRFLVTYVAKRFVVRITYEITSKTRQLIFIRSIKSRLFLLLLCLD